MKKLKTGQSGFTLLELLVVFAVLALLMGLVGPKVLNSLGGAKVKTANLQIKEFETLLDMYMLDVGRYPSTNEGLQALINKPNNARGWNGPYPNSRTIPLDPWQRPYIYVYPGKNSEYDLYSLGKDGQEGGTGENEDANNWGT